MNRALPILVLAAWLAGAGEAQADPFVFVSLPDTQIYADDRFPEPGRTPAVTDPRGTGAIFFDQTRWIVDNADALDIRYVGHLGDIVQNGEVIQEWELAHEAMDLLLQADIPHGTVMGNHDDIESHPPEYMRNYLDFFGPQQFAGRPWYTASSPGGGANLQMLEHGPYKLGFLNFSIDHPRSEVEWATGIVTANPDVIFVIGTHRYLYDFKLGGGRYGEDAQTDLGITLNLPQGFVPGVTDGLSAEELFNEFVSQHPNVLMIHAGHFHAEWLRLDGQNLGGHPIIQILTDYQSTRNGGDGYLRVYELDFDTGQLRFHTYSPSLNRRRTTIDHFLETIYLVYEERGQAMDALGIDDEAVYFQLIPLLLKQDSNVPDGFLLQHPDYDEPEERAYYEQYLSELFHGAIPPGFEDITEWERLWMTGFAASDDPFDFREGVRSPSGVVPVHFRAYFTPTAEQRRALTFGDLAAAVSGVDADHFFRPGAGRVVARRVKQTASLVERGRLPQARRVLERSLLGRVDGCAERGQPDGRHGSRPRPRIDWIHDCPDQLAVHAAILEALDSLP